MTATSTPWRFPGKYGAVNITQVFVAMLMHTLQQDNNLGRGYWTRSNPEGTRRQDPIEQQKRKLGVAALQQLRAQGFDAKKRRRLALTIIDAPFSHGGVLRAERVQALQTELRETLAKAAIANTPST